MAARADPMTMVLVSRVTPRYGASRRRATSSTTSTAAEAPKTRAAAAYGPGRRAPRRSMSLGDPLSRGKDGVMTKPVVILRPAPQLVERIFTAEALERAPGGVRGAHPGRGTGRRGALRRPAAAGVRRRRPAGPADGTTGPGSELRALLNVEGNFFPNVDYATCFAGHPRPGLRARVRHGRRGVRTGARSRPGPRHLAGGPGLPRGARALRLGLDRRLDPAHRRERRAGRLRQPGPGPAPAAAAVPASLQVYDPWLPASVIAEHGATASPLMDLLGTSEFVFVLATVTPESEHLLGAVELATCARDPADPGQPRRRGGLRRPAAPRGGGSAAGRGRRLADRAGPSGPPRPGAGRAGAVGPPGRRDPGRRSPASGTWWSTTWPRSPAACRRCGCRSPAASWSPATATAR